MTTKLTFGLFTTIISLDTYKYTLVVVCFHHYRSLLNYDDFLFCESQKSEMGPLNFAHVNQHHNVVLLSSNFSFSLAVPLLDFLSFSFFSGLGHHCAYLRIYEPHCLTRSSGTLACRPVPKPPAPSPRDHLRD